MGGGALMFEEAKKALQELGMVNDIISAEVRWWQKIFWFLSDSSLAWRVAEKCRRAIKAIESDSVIEARQIVFSIRDDYELRASLFYGPTARAVYPREINLLDEALFKL